MSRKYEMKITVKGHDLDKKNKISDVIEEEWEIDSGFEENYGKVIVLFGTSNLSGGETEKSFVSRVQQAVWFANGKKYCEVEVVATYLEDLPFEIYESRKEDFLEWMREEG